MNRQSGVKIFLSVITAPIVLAHLIDFLYRRCHVNPQWSNIQPANLIRLAYLSIIYLPRILCLSFVLSYSCRPVILSSCHIRGTLSYSLCFSDQTDQGNETEGLEREGLRWRDRKETDRRGRVWRDFSLFKPNLRNMNVHSATCSYSVELYKLWYTLADFFPKLVHFAGFSLRMYHLYRW